MPSSWNEDKGKLSSFRYPYLEASLSDELLLRVASGLMGKCSDWRIRDRAQELGGILRSTRER